jgi:hypothetical protein
MDVEWYDDRKDKELKFEINEEFIYTIAVCRENEGSSSSYEYTISYSWQSEQSSSRGRIFLVDGIIFKILKLSPLPKLGSFYLVSSI